MFGSDVVQRPHHLPGRPIDPAWEIDRIDPRRRNIHDLDQVPGWPLDGPVKAGTEQRIDDHVGGDEWVVLSGGTDGEDGPTDAAGAVCDDDTFRRAAAAGLNAKAHLRRHDAYPLFNATGDLIRTGLTQTNVMDVRVILID